MREHRPEPPREAALRSPTHRNYEVINGGGLKQLNSGMISYAAIDSKYTCPHAHSQSGIELKFEPRYVSDS